jgi:hypothetical protein
MIFYDQQRGEAKLGDVVFSGYSGAGEGKNNPAMQTVHNVGPIPRGVWRMGTPYDSPHTGPYTVPLTPEPGTETFGRADFRIHGDSKTAPGTASHGCIILARAFREKLVNGNADKLVTVV